MGSETIIDKWALFRELGYEVKHPEVRRFHDSTARVKVASAPRRTSKSYSAAKDILVECLTPGARVWIVGPNYGLAEKEFRYIHEDLVLKRKVLGLPAPKVCQTNARSGQLYIKWPWGAILEGKSADNPESLLGEAVDVALYSEGSQLPRQIRERYVQPTLVTKKGREIIPTTPDQGGEWVHELIEKAEQGDHGIDSFHWDVTANPKYDMEEFDRARKFYGEESPVFREQYLGEWVFYGGRVYGTFQESIHVIEPFEIPNDWAVIRGIDFGHRDPFVCLWCAVGPSNELYFFREYYSREGKSIREHALNIKAMSAKMRIGLTVGDPSAAQAIDDICYEGIPTVPANNDRTAGRMRVLEYLMPSEDGIPPYPIKDLPIALAQKRWPRVYYFNTLKETIREKRYYRWKEGAQREGDREKTEGDDHAMDTERYIVMTRPSPYKMTPKNAPGSFGRWLGLVRKGRMSSTYIGGANG